MKKESINKLFISAKKYAEEFAGMNYVFVYRENDGILSYKEVMFTAPAFKHLTGIKVNIRPDEFLDACINKRLPSSVFDGKMDLPEVKLSVLPSLLNTAVYRYIGEFVPSGVFIETETLAGNSYACLGIDKRDGERFYYPKTILKEDIRKRVDKAFKIVAILSKRIDDDLYTITNFISKDITTEQLSELSAIISPANTVDTPKD